MKRLFTIFVAALMSLLLLAPVGCQQSTLEVVEVIAIFPAEPGSPPPTSGWAMPGAPANPHPDGIQRVFRPGGEMFLGLSLSSAISGEITFSKFTFLNQETGVEQPVSLTADMGPFEPGRPFLVGFEEPWRVPDTPGTYKIQIYLEDTVAASAIFEVSSEINATPPPVSVPPPPRTDWEPGSAPPVGIGSWEQPRELTEKEKAEVIEIALNSPRVSEWLQGKADYRTVPLDWYAIIWGSNGELGTWWSVEYDRVANEGIPDYINPYALWYPGVTIAVGEGTIYQMQIAIDLDSGEIAMADGPYPSLSSPDRFKNMLPPPPTGTWTTFTTDDGLASNVVTSVTQDNQGIIWIGSLEGLTRYDGAHFEVYPSSLVNTHIACAAQDRQGNLWFGAYGEGLFKYNGKDWQNYTPGNTSNGLPGAAIKDILVDNQGNIWLATVGNVGQRTAPMDHGVTRYDGTDWTSYLDRTDVETIFQDTKGNMWFGTNTGVIRYDGAQWQTFTKEDGLADNYVVAITEDSQGNMWFGTWNDSTSRYDGKNWQTFNPDDGPETSAVHCMLKDSRGNLWFGSYSIDGYYGISRFDGTQWQHFDPWQSENDKHHYNVLSIFEDDEGNIWFATSFGLVCYSPD